MLEHSLHPMLHDPAPKDFELGRLFSSGQLGKGRIEPSLRGLRSAGTPFGGRSTILSAREQVTFNGLRHGNRLLRIGHRGEPRWFFTRNAPNELLERVHVGLAEVHPM